MSRTWRAVYLVLLAFSFAVIFELGWMAPLLVLLAQVPAQERER